jgi:DNA-directed RNA polymerase specialized sigma24 family protein
MTEGMPTRDHFPTTHATWLSDRVGVANDEVARHIMERYFEPLRAYVKGSSLRNFGDSADLVNDFFASRLDDPTYLERWLASGLPLRRWLLNGLLLHVRNRAIAESRRRARGDAGVGGDGARAHDLANARATNGAEPDALAALERAWAIGLVTEAHDRVRVGLIAEHRENWWVCFRLHVLHGLPYADACPMAGVSVANGANIVRAVSKRLATMLAELLSRDGVAEADIDAELELVQRLVQR